MTFPSRDDVRGLSQAFCANVCVCVFVLLVKVRPEERASPQINGVAVAENVRKHSQLFLWGIAWSDRGEDDLTCGFLRALQTLMWKHQIRHLQRLVP